MCNGNFAARHRNNRNIERWIENDVESNRILSVQQKNMNSYPKYPSIGINIFVLRCRQFSSWNGIVLSDGCVSHKYVPWCAVVRTEQNKKHKRRFEIAFCGLCSATLSLHPALNALQVYLCIVQCAFIECFCCCLLWRWSKFMSVWTCSLILADTIFDRFVRHSELDTQHSWELKITFSMRI